MTSAPPGPGGLSWDKRRLLWGYGNTAANGATGDVNPVAGLNSVNPVNGKKFNVSKTLGMANGIAKAPNGAIFASNDFGQKLDRITTKGFTINGWALVDKANGLTISPDGKFIYANLIFSVPPTIASIEIADAANVTTYAAAPADTPMSILDGLTRDDAGNLYVAAWGKGEVESRHLRQLLRPRFRTEPDFLALPRQGQEGLQGGQPLRGRIRTARSSRFPAPTPRPSLPDLRRRLQRRCGSRHMSQIGNSPSTMICSTSSKPKRS